MRVAAVILAAGASRRYGEDKLLVQLDGKPLLQHAIDAAESSTVDEVIVVLGHDAPAIRESVRLRRARVVTNPDHASGQSTSLRLGIRAVSAADGAVVLLGDQPRVTARLIDALIARARLTAAAAVVSSWNGRRSPPTLLRRELWPTLEGIAGDVGAREILAGRDDVDELDVTAELGSLEDVDRPSDLARIAKAGKIQL